MKTDISMNEAWGNELKRIDCIEKDEKDTTEKSLFLDLNQAICIKTDAVSVNLARVCSRFDEPPSGSLQ